MIFKTCRGGMASLILLVSTVAFNEAAAATSITDQNGRPVSIPNQVNRLASLVIPGASLAIAVDQSPTRLVGIHPAARREIVDGLLGRMMPETRTIPSNIAGDGFMPNVEALLAAHPDVVVQWGDKGSAIVDPIIALGLPVVTLRYGSSDLVAEWLRLMGMALTGREVRARKLATQFLIARKGVARAAATVPVSRRPRVIYLYRTQGNAFEVAGKKTSMDSDIRLAGGVNVAGELTGFTQVSVEQLLSWQPDIVLLNNFEPRLRPSALMNNPLLRGVPAIQESRVYIYPQGGFRWDPPSHESPLAWRWLLTLLHPEMPTKSLRKEIARSYQLLYGYTPTSDDIDTVLRVNENGESRYYKEKFGRTTVWP